MGQFKGTRHRWISKKRNSTLFEIRNEEGKLVCELESYERNKQIMAFKELESNAKLMASAPELLEILNLFIKEFEYENATEYKCELFLKAKQLIKKATE